MRNLNILVIFFLLSACSDLNSKTTNEEPSTYTVSPQHNQKRETKSKQKIEEISIVEEHIKFDSTGKPSHPVIRNLQIDTSKLFGVWANEHSYPNAAFSIDKDDYYIADFDGDPVVQYILDGDSITLFFEWGKKTSRISIPKPDLLIMTDEDGQTYQYRRFKN